MQKIVKHIAAAVVLLASSSAWSSHLPSNANITVTGNSGTECQTLFAGQTIDAGNVCFEIDASGENMTVTYDTINGWELTEAHLWVGDSPEGYPQTRRGNPKIGIFPFNSGDITGATSYSFTVSLADWHDLLQCDQSLSLYAMAHAAVRRDNGDGGYDTETGWADGDRVTEKGSWATLVTLDIGVTCEDEPTSPPPSGHDDETAFAVGETCFLDIDEDGDGDGDFNRWGWSIGPLGVGTTSHDIYAGAGQCDLGKGEFVGVLTVSYDGSTATVIYDTAAGYHFDETHVYVGNEILPRDVNGDYTVAPGQYPQSTEHIPAVESVTYTFNDLSGDIQVVAHAVAGPF